MKKRFTQAVEIKKLLSVVGVLVFLVFFVSFGVFTFFYDLEKPVKINANSFTTTIDRNEVAHLLGIALASENATAILGAKTPIEVKKEGKVQKAEFSFNALAPVWEADTPEGTEVTLQIRASIDGQNWSGWKTVEEDEDGDAKDGTIPSRSYGRLILLEGEYIQQRVIFKTNSLEKIPEVKSIEFVYIDSIEKLNFFERLVKKFKLGVNEVFAVSDVPKRPTDKPNICSRACWKADESIYVPGEDYVSVKKMIVHHTVTSNNDSNPAATVRAIYYFHNVIRGWGDIGYNFLIDQKNGTIYEGRYGGDSVVGAHTRGYNRGSVGVAVLGDFRFVGVNNKVRNALHKIAVWKFYNHKIDPDKSTSFGNPKRTLPSVFYHGQVGNTACAGSHLNIFVPSIKKMAHYMPQQIVFRDSSGAKLIAGSNTKTAGGLLNVYRSKGTVALNYIRKIAAFPTDGITLPNDPNYSSQWDLTKLDALNVWKQTSGGNPSIKVAVLDTGVAYEDYDPPGSEVYTKGPDFVNINFTSGYDYVNNDNQPNDDHGHGTTVASVIASSTNDGVGSASIAYNVSIMPVKICDKDGWCTDIDMARGIDFARNNGAKVINISIGGPDSSSVIQDAVEEAWKLDIRLVGASGNENKDLVSFPAKAKYVIAVGATTSLDTKASYSSYGSGLDLVAPGGSATNGPGDLLYQKLTCTTSLDCTSFSYSYIAGTSFSTALVSAASATYFSIRPEVRPASIIHALRATAVDLGSEGYDEIFGHGRLNLSIFYDYIFFDILPSNTLYPFLKHLVDENVLKGYRDGTFKPSVKVTRAHIAIMVMRGFGLTIDTSGTPFSDVPVTHGAFEAIQTLKNLGVTDGYPDGSFRSDNTVTREQAMKFVVLAARSQGQLLGYENPGEIFPDVPDGANFEEYIERAYQGNVIAGYPDGLFRPLVNLTRGTAAIILSNAKNELGL